MSVSQRSRLDSVHRLVLEGKREQARAMAARLVQASPGDAAVNHLYSEILRSLGDNSKAIFYADRACQAAPQNASTHALRAKILLGLGRFEEAILAARRALDLAPEDLSYRASLADILFARARVCEVIDAATVNGEIPVQNAALAMTAGYALAQAGRHEECQRLFARAAAAHPNDTTLASARCSASLYAPGVSRDEVFAVHRAYGQLVAELHAPGRPALLRSPDPDRRLRVGILSPDLRRHSVAFFMAPLFERHEPERTELIVFDTSAPGQGDDMTERLRSRASLWRKITPRSLLEFADSIRSDQVDVLIELSGHTGAHALEIMPYGPAPVTMSYLGYASSTGLSCMDYRIVDSVTDPPPSADALASERLLRMDPCFVCYSAPPLAPGVALVEPGRPITFGSFNNSAKLNEPLLALWARILAAVPSSSIMLKAISFVDTTLREDLVRRFERKGVDPRRVRFASHSATIEEHLAHYAEIDVALDSFPYHGTTTTCDALFMGVPVVTLMGDCHRSRVGGSLLSAAGAPEWIASSEEEYVSIAAGLAADRDRLAAGRSALRERLLASTLCDASMFARRFEAVIRRAWQDRCRGAQTRLGPDK